MTEFMRGFLTASLIWGFISTCSIILLRTWYKTTSHLDNDLLETGAQQDD